MQSLPPRHLCTSRSSIDTDMALLADIFICQPSISHHAIAILVDCWPTCWSICRSTPDQVSANMSTNMSAYTWPVCPLTPGWHISRLCFKIRTRELGFSVTHKISQSEVWNSFCSVVRVIPPQPHWVSLSDFCRGSTHFLMLHCPWIPLKCDAIAVPIFSKKQKIISN